MGRVYKTHRYLAKSQTLRPFRDFDAYLIGIEGAVWSCLWSRGERSHWWHKLKPTQSKSGYLQVVLSKNGQRHIFSLHRLVLEAFVGPCPPGMEACHYPDPTPSNCRLDNLRWDTRQANSDDKTRPVIFPEKSEVTP